MKRWITFLCAALALAFLGIFRPEGTSFDQIEPVEAIFLSRARNSVTIMTDTGASGTGKSLAEAAENLRAAASGEIFLETADYCLFTAESVDFLSDLPRILRPGCKLVLCKGADLTDAAAYLSVHEPEFTLLCYQIGYRDYPTLTAEERGFALAS
ncbi:MAG: hypothetical protein LUH51_01990 [Firmicutes bacterium]|nr:hypothetical protein [Bacillota bacterium]